MGSVPCGILRVSHLEVLHEYLSDEPKCGRYWANCFPCMSLLYLGGGGLPMSMLLLLLLLSHFSHVQLCDPIDSSQPGFTVPEILQERTLEWVAVSFSNAWKWKVKVKLLSRVRLFATPWTAAYQAPPSMGFSRQEDWSGLPLPSLANEYDCVAINLHTLPSISMGSASVDSTNCIPKTLEKKFRKYQKQTLNLLHMIKNRNGMNLTEAEDIKKRW